MTAKTKKPLASGVFGKPQTFNGKIKWHSTTNWKPGETRHFPKLGYSITKAL